MERDLRTTQSCLHHSLGLTASGTKKCTFPVVDCSEVVFCSEGGLQRASTDLLGNSDFVALTTVWHSAFLSKERGGGKDFLFCCVAQFLCWLSCIITSFRPAPKLLLLKCWNAFFGRLMWIFTKQMKKWEACVATKVWNQLTLQSIPKRGWQNVSLNPENIKEFAAVAIFLEHMGSFSLHSVPLPTKAKGNFYAFTKDYKAGIVQETLIRDVGVNNQRCCISSSSSCSLLVLL